MVGQYITGRAAEDCEVLSRYDAMLGGPGGCCADPKRCTRTGRADEMKLILGNIYGIAGFHHVRPLRFNEIVREIRKNRPFIIAMRKPRGGHVVVISGYHYPDKVVVLDPIYGRQIVPYRVLRHNSTYGVWTDTLTLSGRNPFLSAQSYRRQLQQRTRYPSRTSSNRRQPTSTRYQKYRYPPRGYRNPAQLYCCNRHGAKVCRITVNPGPVGSRCFCYGFRGTGRMCR